MRRSYRRRSVWRRLFWAGVVLAVLVLALVGWLVGALSALAPRRRARPA